MMTTRASPQGCFPSRRQWVKTWENSRGCASNAHFKRRYPIPEGPGAEEDEVELSAERISSWETSRKEREGRDLEAIGERGVAVCGFMKKNRARKASDMSSGSLVRPEAV